MAIYIYGYYRILIMTFFKMIIINTYNNIQIIKQKSIITYRK